MSRPITSAPCTLVFMSLPQGPSHTFLSSSLCLMLAPLSWKERGGGLKQRTGWLMRWQPWWRAAVGCFHSCLLSLTLLSLPSSHVYCISLVLIFCWQMLAVVLCSPLLSLDTTLKCGWICLTNELPLAPQHNCATSDGYRHTAHKWGWFNSQGMISNFQRDTFFFSFSTYFFYSVTSSQAPLPQRPNDEYLYLLKAFVKKFLMYMFVCIYCHTVG